MDEKIQLGPRAQVTWVKGSSGGAKASDSGEMTQRAEASLCEKDLETQHRSEKKEKTLFITQPSFFHLVSLRKTPRLTQR